MSKVFSPQDLASYNGVDKEQIYFSVRGKVYDVTDASSFYGPGSGYHIFAGKECSRALGTMSLKEEDVNGDLEGLDEKQMGVLNNWQEKFDSKYPFVGRLES